MRYTLTMAASRLGLEPRQLRRCLHIARITPAINPHDAREMLVSEEDMARLQAVARELWPDATARTEDLAGRISDLERRVRALETRQHAPALPTAYTPPLPRETPPAPSYVRASLDADTGEMFPQSLRGKGEWVEAHGGPGRHYVREWREARDWHSAADAIRAVRARGWPDFMRGRDTADTRDAPTSG